MPGSVTLIDPQGVARDVPAEQASDMVNRGWRPQTHADVLAGATAAANEADYGGVHGAIGAIGAGLGRGLTLGATDALARAVGGEDAASTLRGLQTENPALSTGSDVVGAIIPAVISGGASLPAGMAARAGAAVTEGLGRGFLAHAVGGAAEGALFGAGQGVSELALSADPLTMEHAASVLSSNALYGAGFGAAGGVAAKGVEVGLGKARDAVHDYLLERSGARAGSAIDDLSAQAAAEPAAIGPETDVTLLDKSGLKAAREQELERLRTAQEPAREDFVANLERAHKLRDQDKEWLSIVADRHENQYARESAAVVLRADRKVRNLLDNRVGLAQKPERALEALQLERQAVENLREVGEREMNTFYTAFKDAPDTVRKELLANKIPGYVVGKGGISSTSPVIDDIVKRVVDERFPPAAPGSMSPAIPKELAGFAMAKPDLLLMQNERLQSQIAALHAEPRSARLAQIDAAQEALGVKTVAPKPEPESSLGGKVLSAAAHLAGGPLGSIATTAAGALGGLKKAIGGAAERAAKAADGFLAPAARGAGKLAPAAPILATKVLAGLRYGEPGPDDENAAPASSKLADLYRARTGEVKQLVQMAPDGSFQMRPEARQALAKNLSGLGMVDPVAADRLESAGAARIAWLASQIPRRPDMAGIQVGPDTWHPSDLDMRSWARKAAAADDPHGVLERVMHGAVTPEDAAAMKALYPEMMAAFINNVSAQLPTLRKILPYARQLALSMFSGVPVDPALDPRVLAVLQGQFTDEPGTSGGTSAPKPQPQFGSIKKSPDAPTPAQNRAQGAHA